MRTHELNADLELAAVIARARAPWFYSPAMTERLVSVAETAVLSGDDVDAALHSAINDGPTAVEMSAAYLRASDLVDDLVPSHFTREGRGRVAFAAEQAIVNGTDVEGAITLAIALILMRCTPC